MFETLRWLFCRDRNEGRVRQDGERCGTCCWCDVVDDDPAHEPNGYCAEPGVAMVNAPYAGTFTHTQWWCRMYEPAQVSPREPDDV